MARGLDIAVAASGIGGLASAILLARQGHRVRVFDRFEAPRSVGSGLMLQKTGLVVLEAMGLRAQIDDLGQPIERLWGLTTPSLRPVLDVRYKSLRSDLCGIGVQRGLIFNILLEAALEAGAELVPNTEIKYVDPASAIISLADAPQIGPFDLIIDALGVRSPLTVNPRRDLPYGALWATLPWPEHGPFDARALEQRYFKASKMAGVMASGRLNSGTPETLTYFWSIEAGQEARWRSRPLHEWKEEAAALWPETQVLLDQLADHEDLTFARYRHRTHPSPVAGPNLVHIGDAWHAASPQLGQGANMALLDAYALAKALEEGSDRSDALYTYQKLRVAHVRMYQWMTWAFTPVYQGRSHALPWLRDWLAAPLSRIPPGPQILAAMVSGAIGSPLKKLGLL